MKLTANYTNTACTLISLDVRSFGFAFLQRAPEPVGLGSSLDDIGAVSDAVEQRLAQPGIGNHRGPLRKRQIGSDDDGGLLGPFGNDLEQKFGADLGQRHISSLHRVR